MLEKLMYKRLFNYLEKENILFPSQYGYSTNLASIELMTKISQAIHNNEYTSGVFLHLAKAFDTVDHE